MAGHVSDAVIRRLPGYYRHLRELESAGVEQISSQELGERMHLTPSQIRQDINCFGGFGRQGYGYKVSDLKMHIGEILGLDREHTEIIVGAGNIGCAIAKYPTFQREGFRPLAMFDNDPEKIGVPVGDIPDLQRIIHGVEVGAYRTHVRPQVLHLVERDKISARTYKTPLQCAVGSVERIIKNRRRAAGEHKQCQQHTQEADGSLFHGCTSFLFFITVYHS